ncbi:PucR family transcriptional regulator [Nocardia amikacinitolerans]|uniref:PucR family transcriptional regulator n=1 Tax=Nocardia amikacinitolerans TaxID=756689 RepID=UPI0020A50DB3|nr:helix-turn-helix domain-containing protein [Nocardia amikacinitolerans]
MTNVRHDDIDADRYIAAIAARLTERAADVCAIIRSSLEDDIAQLRGDPRTDELLCASIEANVGAILNALRYSLSVAGIQVPHAAAEYSKRAARQGIPAMALIQGYRLGQRRMTELVFAELHTPTVPPADRIPVIERITAIMSEYIDRITEQGMAIYDAERARWLENQNSIRAVRVREVLGGRKNLDVDAVTEVIRYPLRWHHLALVLWYPDSEADSDALPRLQRLVRELAEKACTAAKPLIVAADQVSAWAWLPYRAQPGDLISGIRKFVAARQDAPDIAIGTFGIGLDGFRRSHRSAQRARTVALARGLPSATVVAAGDPGLATAALLGADLAETREWVCEVLGDLSGDNKNDARLRETLRVFLRTGSSYKAAAAELDLHFNTVKYRVGRAVVRRGRPIGDDRLDVELALLTCHWYGSVVLRPTR